MLISYIWVVEPRVETIFLSSHNIGLPEEMAAAGYKSITSIDFSPVVISHMQEKYKDHAALTCMYITIMVLTWQLPK